ncbi:MAG TPA: 5'-3' exonuclease [Actinophytocola sp.]|uniref:5'-3' exonuclease n=1 Tax=Actinophytocola sp. TaxID=1872138 RepID=UPI002DDD2BF5|nr:5'-3' exonuclease [Actinophytocola sp.]HEV2780547.1 5'-3' exonuclease [Actinophytocola sp.]
MSGPLALLDSASLYFRAFYALPDSMRAPDGQPVNAVRGFADAIARVLTDRRPSRLVACLDADWRPAFRVKALPSYKTHRVADPKNNIEEVPDALTPQIPIILDLLDAFGIATAEADGYEADDVIGTLAAKEGVDPVEVITGDRDLFQVVRAKPTPVSVVYVGAGWAKVQTYGPAEVAARYGLPVANAGPAYADMAALRGDPSDGLPGVTGIGEKTAAKLITRFGSFEGLVAAAAQDNSPVPLRWREALAAEAKYVAAAPLVVRVAVDASVTVDRDDRVPDKPRDLDRVRELQERWNLSASVDRLLAALA